jgi:hypothetical protein
LRARHLRAGGPGRDSENRDVARQRLLCQVSHDRIARLPSDLQAVEEALMAAGALIVVVDNLQSAYYCNPNESDWAHETDDADHPDEA